MNTPPPPPVKRLTILLVALMALTAPAAVSAQTPTECTLADATLAKLLPVGDSPLVEGGVQAIFGVSFPNTCPVRTKPLTVCLDLWNTTACPPTAPENECDGRIRGSIGFFPTGGWERTSGPTVCNSNFLTDLNGSIQYQLNFLFSLLNDNIKADRQNYFIVHMHEPFQVLRIPIMDDD